MAPSTSPSPNSKQYRAAKFWDWISARYAKSPISDEASYRKKLDVTRSYLRPDMRLLEFGCGTGSTALAHAPYVNHIHAIDISSRMIEIARAKADESQIRNVTFAQGTLDSLDAPDGGFDAVLGLNVLHLLNDYEQAIARVHRLLRPGGVFISSTACIGDSMKWFRFIAPVGKLSGYLPQVTVFTSDQLVHSLTRAGFEIDYRWQPPSKMAALFIVAKRPA
jgi:ubiquinone/menaquinone biosynthesis C-methylase UbiE